MNTAGLIIAIVIAVYALAGGLVLTLGKALAHQRRVANWYREETWPDPNSDLVWANFDAANRGDHA